MKLRPYQQETLDKLYQWWQSHTKVSDFPILDLPTGAGKSLIIAELVRLMFDTWPDHHPRTLVIVPSKELAEQNAEKLAGQLPSHISLGYYSASIGKRQPDKDVIVATIGSVYAAAHLLGDIKIVIIDECHLVKPEKEGRYRNFLFDLAQFCHYRIVGLTATPFRGNGVWLTDGENPLFKGVAHKVTIKSLLDAGYLAPLVRPMDLANQIDTTGIATTGGDYNLEQLDQAVNEQLIPIADESVRVAADRHHWLVFTPMVVSAHKFRDLLVERGITAQCVTGKTPKAERAQVIADFRSGKILCLITVMALATGFDAPEVDCILWLRPTISPVLYVQGAGRGLRIAEGKTDCLWVDFTDTTERLGAIDLIKGRKKPRSKAEEEALREAPLKVCDQCGSLAPIAALECPDCGALFPPQQIALSKKPSEAAVLSTQKKQSTIKTYPVTRVSYRRHSKEGSPDSMRVDYYSGLNRIASEWICLYHTGFAQAKAAQWLKRNMGEIVTLIDNGQVNNLSELLYWANQNAPCPTSITLNEAEKYPSIISTHFEVNHDTPRIERADRDLYPRTSRIEGAQNRLPNL